MTPAAPRTAQRRSERDASRVIATDAVPAVIGQAMFLTVVGGMDDVVRAHRRPTPAGKHLAHIHSIEVRELVILLRLCVREEAVQFLFRRGVITQRILVVVFQGFTEG